ncbi:PREDICTED: uncharacterized protein C2orf50 homolog [Sturnus vulgaris]|uniref:uncharacterized protein C2orf50 homolog n=1 Tax=Sturnus vulgaris TaxID=9172 RepID=UPI00071A45BA|nr:PREDICTED: uncharacterized protein C2orf50 homolog [Sturnus vulgaris]
MVSLKMDKLERGSRIRRNTLVRSQLTATTPLGQPAPAPSASQQHPTKQNWQPLHKWLLGPEQTSRQSRSNRIRSGESVEAEQRGRRIWYQNWSFLKDQDQMVTVPYTDSTTNLIHLPRQIYKIKRCCQIRAISAAGISSTATQGE